ncbi:protein required for assembly of ubiquinol cytochrome-c reductase complex (cytochrome bc1 complex) [Pseudohyphozyma bogoriensis]|nr:protein required for assembly of ubiquinol cytochrome-c reductase complex (cytochrome bc1 complex) [Pseudohyphozyma bogoriensis]
MRSRATQPALRALSPLSAPSLQPSIARPTASSSAALVSRSYSAPPTPTPSPPPPPSSSRPTNTPTPTNLPGSNLPGASKYSPLTVSVVKTLAKVFGYNSQTSTAIRTASDYYDRCAERGEIEAPFFYEECSLPPSFQTWFSITTLHVWLISVRFRNLPAPLGRTYIQELINHFFIDVELRIRGPYGVTHSRLIKGYMKDMLEQYRGSVAAYDEALVGGDAVLAAAVWRNLFGAGWGGMGGVKGKHAFKEGERPELSANPTLPTPKPSKAEKQAAAAATSTSSSSSATPLTVDPFQQKILKKNQAVTDVFNTDVPITDPSRLGREPLYPEHPDLEFVPSLEKIVVFIRAELHRLENLSDEVVVSGKPVSGSESLTGFGLSKLVAGLRAQYPSYADALDTKRVKQLKELVERQVKEEEEKEATERAREARRMAVGRAEAAMKRAEGGKAKGKR